MQRIHITGPPRSGTTLMLELLVTCFAIDVYSKKEISVLVPPPKVKPDATVCTKNPGEWSIIGDLLQCDPEQWFIFMMRDPRDVVVSRHTLKPDMYWANLRQWRSAWDAVKEMRTHDRLLIIYYEELVKDPDRTQAAIAKRLPFLNITKQFSRFHLHANPSQQSLEAMRNVRPISRNSIGKWREHRARLAGQLKLHGPITDDLVELGYEKDDAWLRELDDIVPDTSAGFWQDFISPENQQAIKLKLNRALQEYKKTRGLETR